jgi:alpha-L-arabinofuranosidase
VPEARLTLDPAFRVADVDPRLFGSFVEHMGRCVYTGIYEPGHPSADAEGFRQDVADLVRELGVPVLRYPGGNFVSTYNWEDGVGPRAERPVRLDAAWRSIETNQVGVDDFVAWARRVGSEPMMAVNLGTRGVAEARDLVEYCNFPAGSTLADQRRRNGAEAPHDIKLWCLGNELDGPWQIGAKTAAEYARVATEAAKAMRRVDPTIELVACGSSNRSMPSFGTWEATVLAEAYDVVDYISLHNYYQEAASREEFLASSWDMDQFIDATVATCDHARAVGRHRKRVNLAFDEWNVWYQNKFDEQRLEYVEAPRLIEDTYSVLDAVVVGSLLITLLRHADRVRVACLAQLVNVIAPIRSEPGGPAWRQSIFHPFALTSRYGRGTVLRVEPVGEAVAPEVPLVDATAVLDEESGQVTLFTLNRSLGEPAAVEIDLRAFPALTRGTHVGLFDADPDAVNSAAAPDRVTPKALDDVVVDGGRARVVLPPTSWSMVRLL